MDKNEAKLLVLNYLSNLDEAKKELAKIKIITNLQEQHEKAESAHRKHSTYSQLIIGHYNSYNLSGEINSNSVAEYDWVVRQLYNLSHEVQDSQGQNQTNRLSHCAKCDKKSSLYHFIWDKRTKKLEKSYNNATDSKNQWVFCNKSCFNEWYKKWWSSLEDELKTFTCKGCKNKFQVEREYKRGKEITKNYDFCSQNCLNSWNQNNLKEQTNKKQCSGSGCSSLLTSEEICYCSTCSKKQEQIWKNLEKNQQDINKDLDNFQQGLNNYADQQKNNSNNNQINNPNIEREREQNILQQSQLLSQITQLETNPTQQAELAAKKQQLKDLENKQKELTKSLPLDTQITILEREIKQLTNKPARTATEEALLTEKQKELAELLAKQSSSNVNNSDKSDKTGLYVGCGIVVGLLILFLIAIFTKNRKKKKF